MKPELPILAMSVFRAMARLNDAQRDVEHVKSQGIQKGHVLFTKNNVFFIIFISNKAL